VIWDVLSPFQVGQKFYGHDAFIKCIKDVLYPALGIDKHSELKTNKNKDEYTKQAFPLERINVYCGNCSPKERDVSSCHRGCCGLHIQAKLVKNDKHHDRPHLVITKFTLPVTSKHVIISDEVKKKIRETEAFTHESQLSEEQTRALKTFGKYRQTTFYCKEVEDGLSIDQRLDHLVK